MKEFLLLDEITKTSTVLLKEEKKDIGVEINDLTCYWDENLDAPTLQNITLSLGSNQLLAVIGPVGAGKSSLLSSILGELPSEKGILRVKGQLTYAAQQPWVFPGTIRSNILFGKDLEPQKYERVIKACALKRDLELLPDGDQTLIGDRGATLSGGQKARVNLARAVYQDADVYLLDDPLSAVDAEVGRHLFEQCICGLLKNKPRILVTHQLQYLKTADQIFVLKEGHMVAKGMYTELQRSGVDFTSLLKKEEEEEQQQLQPPQDVPDRRRTLSQTSSVQSVKDGDHLPVGTGILSMFDIIYCSVTPSGGAPQVSYVMHDWWLAYWAGEQDKLTSNTNGSIIVNGTNVTSLDLGFYLGIYGGLTAATILFGFMRNIILFTVLVKSAQTLHNTMFNAILRAPVRFFDINPIELDAGSVGLALSYAVTLMGMFQWGVRQSAEVENMMTSVERMVEYTELESEAPWETQKRPPSDWPSKGLVTFDHVSFSYSDDSPKVLHNLQAMFRPKEKVGIVGRTGAGKSSLVSALFRLAEPEGKIYIDGVVTSEIGLHDLRQKMSIIPQ
ncbi:hypothetical protein GOODEAATRI_016590, partial [Goodea atripinnis]